MVALNQVQIPGYAEALRREDSVRREAFSHSLDSICGVPVRPLTLRDAITLEEMRNGFFCPFTFDADDELIGHCAQLVWWLSDCPKPGFYTKSIWQWRVAIRRRHLCRYLGQFPTELVQGVHRFLKDAFFDAPKPSNGVKSAAVAAGPAYVFDTLAQAGYVLTPDQILDMPLAQLWQVLRLASRRLYGAPAVNESDRIATEYLETLNKTEARHNG